MKHPLGRHSPDTAQAFYQLVGRARHGTRAAVGHDHDLWNRKGARQAVIWPFRNRQTDEILERAAEPLWKVSPPRPWPEPPKGKEKQLQPQLGTMAKDKITGFSGRIVGRCEYLTGCTQYLLVPPIKADGDLGTSSWFDEDRVEVTDSIPLMLTVTKNGPDMPAPTK